MLRQALPSSSSLRPTGAAFAPWHPAQSLVPSHRALRARLASSQTPSSSTSPTSPNEPIPLNEAGPPDEHLQQPHTLQEHTLHSELSAPPRAEENVDKLEEFKTRLQEWTQLTSAQLRQRIDGLSHNAAKTFSHLGVELNRVTGYEEIDMLKKRVVQQEEQINATRQRAREAKEAHDKAIRDRAASQREVNDLLQRKSHWSDEDVGRFTSLVREDHLREQGEAHAKTAALAAEDAVEREFDELMRVILNRYHEEQAWSDKIRSASTYGSLLVLGVNTLVFVLAIVLVEPWKRRRLAQTFERKVDELAEHTTTVFHDRTNALALRLQEQEKAMERLLETVYYGAQPAAAPVVIASADADSVDEVGPVREDSSQALNRQVAFAIASSAAVASILGWLAGSWFG